MTTAPPAVGRAASARVADADLLGFRDLLPPVERTALDEATALIDRVIRPVVGEHWDRATFPHEVVPEIAAGDLIGLASGGSRLLHGLVHLELARVDLSMSTFLGVHTELAMASVQQFGSDEHRRTVLPELRSLRSVGAFALTEPDHGSDVSRNMETTATRRRRDWVLEGSKHWIGNAPHADVLCVWARDTADGRIRGFLVDRATPGLTVETIRNKIALRVVQSGHVELDGVRIPDSARLPGADGFGAIGDLLTGSRIWVAWQSVGVQFAAYERALSYALQREQFGKPVASFQLVQQKLVRILENATATLGMLVRIAQLQDQGLARPEHAALAKASGSERMRESVALARAVFGGNGITTDFGIARVFADAEALYSYEGSHDVTTLVVGRAITGISAFG